MSCEANLEQELDDVCQLAHDSYLPDLSAEFWDNFEDFTETEQSPHGSITSYWTKKKPWSENEDRQLLELVNEYGPTGHW